MKRYVLFISLLISLVLCASGAANAADPSPQLRNISSPPINQRVRLHNRWKPGRYMNVETFRLSARNILPGWASASWKIIPVGNQGYFRIQNTWKVNKPVIHLEEGFPKVSPAPIEWESALWKFIPINTDKGTAFQIRNKWKSDHVLHIEWGRIGAHPADKGVWSSHWYVEPTAKQVVSPKGFSLDYFKMATYNVYFVTGAGNRKKRARAIGSNGRFYDNDVFVLNELFAKNPLSSNNANKILLAKIGKWYPHRSSTSNKHGVIVLSKWPIISERVVPYQELCGFDGGLIGARLLAYKAFIHTKIRYQHNKIINVIGTHMQSEDKGCKNARPGFAHGYPQRRSGFKQIRDYVRNSIPRGEAVVLAGDLNVIKGSAEYQEVIRTNPFVIPTFGGHPFTFDTVKNPLVHENYRSDPPQTLDYIFWLKNRPAPSRWHNIAVKLDNLSDHYPVFGMTK